MRVLKKRKRAKKKRPGIPYLRFTPYSWARLRYLRDAGETEIAAMGLSSLADPLLVEDLLLVRQQADWASVALDDEAVARLFDEQVEQGRTPAEFGRIWLHTHPGRCPQPSATDEVTFARVFGSCDWSVMFILARGGRHYARLQFGVGPGGQMKLPVRVEWQRPFNGADHKAWKAEYRSCVVPASSQPELTSKKRVAEFDPWTDYDEWVWEPRPLLLASGLQRELNVHE